MSALRFPLDPPLITILRGIEPGRAREAGMVLYDVGFRALEVPLNRAGALEAIEVLSRSLPNDCLIGAGTVLTAGSVEQAASAGARLIVAPNCDVGVLARTRELGLFSMPGVATPTEALRAVELHAHALKAFPAEALPPAVIRSWRSVIDEHVPIFPVGGVTPAAMAAYHAAGASGFGVGSQLFQPCLSTAGLAANASAFLAAWNALQPLRQSA